MNTVKILSVRIWSVCNPKVFDFWGTMVFLEVQRCIEQVKKEKRGEKGEEGSIWNHAFCSALVSLACAGS
jgi:hypothetical protein